MAAIQIINVSSIPSGGTYTEYSGLTFSTGTLTAIAGVFDTAFGRYNLRTANGINGGVPNQSCIGFTLFSATSSTIPSGGTYTEYSGLTFSTGTLTAIAGVFDTTLGAFRADFRVNGLIGPATPPAYGLQPIIFAVCG